MKRADYVTKLGQVQTIADLEFALVEAEDWQAGIDPDSMTDDTEAVAAARKRQQEVNAEGFSFSVNPADEEDEEAA